MQSRFILLDPPLVLFALCSVYCYVKFSQQRYAEFSARWWTWLCATGISLALTISCKMVGLFTFATVGGAVVLDLWDLFDLRRGLTLRRFTRHFCARALCLIIVPVFVYLFWFYVHFLLLPRTGTGDSFMSRNFQRSLENNEFLSETLELHAYDQISLKHQGTGRLLHSHDAKYPHKYDDGRISSDGQQVTAYSELDTNNMWQIQPVVSVDNEDGSYNVTKRLLRHKQTIRLLHVNTNSYLKTHDVAAPLMPTNMEVTTLPAGQLDEDEEGNTLFELNIQHGIANQTTLYSRRSSLTLVHIPTRVAIWTYENSQLPDWAFQQYEVNGNKNAVDPTNSWYVDEVDPDVDSPMRDVRQKLLESEPEKPTQLPFMQKFLELQHIMLDQNNKLVMSHPYMSRPVSWPFSLSGVSYWQKDPEHKQIFFIGNPVVWWSTAFAVCLFGSIFGLDLLSRRRGVYLISNAVRTRYLRATGFFAWAWACHYLPFFVMSRQLFLHHYLPAHVFAVLTFGGMLDFFTSRRIDYPLSRPGPFLEPERRRSAMRRISLPSATAFAVVFTLLFVAAFAALVPLTYGIVGLAEPQLMQLRRWTGWNIQLFK